MESGRHQQQQERRLNRAAILSAVICLLLPFLVRLPRGFGWTFQYLWDEGQSLSGAIGSAFLFGIFACLPAVVTAGAVWLSRPRWYLPGVFACVTAFYCLGRWHYANDLGADPQAAISLAFIPIYAAGLAFCAGVAGLVIQAVMRAASMRKHHTEPER